MKDLQNESVLLFCPKFFSYELEIKRALEKLGANVVWYDDRPGNDFLSKGLIRINKKFLKSKIEKYYQKILKDLGKQHIDYLFFVNPEAISKTILKDFREAFPNAKCILYMWDSFDNRRQNVELLPLFDDKFTFDFNDAEKYKLKLRALFYTDVYKRDKKKDVDKYDILFIGTAHTDRYHLVKTATKGILPHRKKMYFYLSSKVLYYTKKAFVKTFKNVSYSDISFKALNHTDIAKLMSETKAVLDINHPKQTGLTMRTLETLGAGRKLITLNQEVMKYDFYDPQNILVIDRQNLEISLDFLNNEVTDLPSEILYKYSIEGWIKEIFDIL
ncbi:CgeB family protein [Mucilaginibacter agri]|uniref:Lipopolysaccharide biosynthesis protein n=1 Tax=Mucilaginibacter agri TaxID=2695265 RepID=A0A966DUT3_9SPHI|nr:lipopolysaccharide biosynthesis protein [Mucilaginibacter agri]NCD70762.1 lipopolysaccharide biosynthesis protein [Mucilaginibacter agri]